MKWLPALTAFVLPLHPRLSALTLGIWAVVAVLYEIQRGVRKRINRAGVSETPGNPFPNAAARWFTMGSILMYGLYGVGLWWTDDFNTGLFAMEVKFSMLLIPCLIAFQNGRFGMDWAKLARKAFLFGLLAFVVWRIGHALSMGEFEYWRYDGLAGPFHPTYMGMYVTMALLILPDRKGWWPVAAMLVGGLFVGLLASKAAWLVSMLAWGVAFAIAIKHKRWIRAWAFTGALVCMGFGAIIGDGGRWKEFQSFVLPPSETRVIVEGTSAAEVDPKPAKVGSSAGRMQAWRAALDVLVSEPIGVGTGDVEQALSERYAAVGADYALQKRMNPHSVWLQIGVSHGVLGCLVLLLWWGGTVVLAIRSRYHMLLFWSVIWLLNGSIESLLELQQGVVPTAFLTLLFASIADYEGRGKGPETGSVA